MKLSFLSFAILLATNCWAQSVDQLQLNCNANNAIDCNYLGSLYLDGKLVPQSFDRAKEYFEKACVLNNQDGCANLGSLYKNGQGVGQSFKTANDLFKTSCESGSGLGCFNLATAYYSAQGMKKNTKTAFSLFSQSCVLNYGQGCAAVGNMYRDGSGVKASNTKAVEFYEKGCKLNSGTACNTLARWAYNGTVIPKSFEQAANYYHKACDADMARSCSNLGHMYEDGEGVEQNYATARQFYDRACALDSGQGCISLGSIYFRGLGSSPSYEEANKAFAKACELGVGLACNYLANDYDAGLGIVQSSAKAQEYYEKACNKKIGLSCFRLGLLAEHGPAGVASYAKARQYYELSCNYKDPSGCEKVGQFYQDGIGVETSIDKANEFFARANEYSAVLKLTSSMAEINDSIANAMEPVTDKQFSDALLKMQGDCSQLSEELNKSRNLHLYGFNMAPAFFFEGLSLSKGPGSTKEKIDVKVDNQNVPMCSIVYTRDKGYETELNYKYLASQYSGKIPQQWADFLNLRLQAQEGTGKTNAQQPMVAANEGAQDNFESPQTEQEPPATESGKSSFDKFFDDLDKEIDEAIDQEFDKLAKNMFGGEERPSSSGKPTPTQPRQSATPTSPLSASQDNSAPLKVSAEIEKLVNATPDTSIQPRGQLYDMFTFGSDYTDLQRKRMLSEIGGKVVVWTLPVYEVREKSKGTYEIFSSGSSKTVSVYIYITPRTQAEVDKIFALKTGDRITVKGVLADKTFFRSLELKPAIFWK